MAPVSHEVFINLPVRRYPAEPVGLLWAKVGSAG